MKEKKGGSTKREEKKKDDGKGKKEKTSKKNSRRLLREIYADKDFLEKLFKDEGNSCPDTRLTPEYLLPINFSVRILKIRVLTTLIIK